MLQIISTLNHQPQTFPYIGLSDFLPGQIVKHNGAEDTSKNITTNSTDQMLGVIDDIYSYDIRENICKRVYLPTSRANQPLYSEIELMIEDAGRILSGLFWSSVPVFLNSSTGKITIPSGSSKSLFKLDEKRNLYYLDVRYTKRISTPNRQNSSPSMNFTVYTKPIVMKTDLFDITQMYPTEANLYFNEGTRLLTTVKPHSNSPCIGFVAGCNKDGDNVLSCAIDINNELTDKQKEIILNSKTEDEIGQKLKLCSDKIREAEDKQISLKENQVLVWDGSKSKWMVISSDEIELSKTSSDKTVLDNLARTSNNIVVRENIALNSNTSTTTLAYLSYDLNTMVRLFVAENKNTPDAVLKELETDITSSVSHAAKNNYALTFFPGGRNYRSCQPEKDTIKTKETIFKNCKFIDNIDEGDVTKLLTKKIRTIDLVNGTSFANINFMDYINFNLFDVAENISITGCRFLGGTNLFDILPMKTVLDVSIADMPIRNEITFLPPDPPNQEKIGLPVFEKLGTSSQSIKDEKQKSSSLSALTAILGLGIACLFGAQQGKAIAKTMKE